MAKKFHTKFKSKKMVEKRPLHSASTPLRCWRGLGVRVKVRFRVRVWVRVRVRDRVRVRVRVRVS